MNNNNLQKKINNKKCKYLVIAGIILILLELVMNSRHSENKISRKEYLKQKEENEKIYRKNFSTTQYKLANGKTLVRIDNKNNDHIIAYYTMRRFDANTYELIQTYTGYIHDIAPNSTIYQLFDAKDDSNFSYNIYIEPKQYVASDKLEFFNDKIEILSSEEINDKIIIKFKNNSKNQIDKINLGVLFYDANNNIIGYDSHEKYDVKENISSMELEKPIDENNNKVEYARFEIIVLNALNMITPAEQNGK